MNEQHEATHFHEEMEACNQYRASIHQRPIKNTSFKQYCMNFNKLLKLVDTSDDKWYENSDKVLETINSAQDVRYPDKQLSMSTKRNYLSALIQIGQYKGLSPDLVKIYMDARMNMNNNMVVKDESNKLVTREEIQTKVFDVLEKGKYIWSCGMDTIQYYLLMKLHFDHNLRNDCCGLKYITQQQWRALASWDQEKENWLVGRAVGRGNHAFTIHLNKYKTKKEGDSRVEIKLSKEMNKTMNHYIKHCWKKHYGEDIQQAPLFVKGLDKDNHLESISSNDMTQLLLKYNQIYLEKKIGTRMLRHSFYTEKYGDMSEELKEDAKSSLHSVGTAINHYTTDTTNQTQ